VRSSSPVYIPMSTFAENVTVRSSCESVLALYPSRVVMCSNESLELLNVVTFVMDGYCKNIFVEYLAEFSPVVEYYALQVWVVFIVCAVMTVPLFSAWAEDFVINSLFILTKRLLPSQYTRMCFMIRNYSWTKCVCVCVCVCLPVMFDSRVDVTPYSYFFSLPVSEFVFICPSIELLFDQFIVRHCIAVRDKDDNALTAEVLWLYPCWLGQLNLSGNMDDTSLSVAFYR